MPKNIMPNNANNMLPEDGRCKNTLNTNGRWKMDIAKDELNANTYVARTRLNANNAGITRAR